MTEVAKDAIDITEPTLSDEVRVEQRAQLDAAIEAARSLAKVVGRPTDRVVVTMSGHANPDHAPRSGWANECITVSVTACPPAE